MVAEAVAVELYRDPGVRQTLTERLIRAGLPVSAREPAMAASSLR